MIACLRLHTGPTDLDEIETVIRDNDWTYNRDRWNRGGSVFTCSLPRALLIDVQLVHPWGIEIETNSPEALREAVAAFRCARPDLEVTASPDYWTASRSA